MSQSVYSRCCWCGAPEFYHYECDVYDAAELLVDGAIVPLFEAIARFALTHPEAER